MESAPINITPRKKAPTWRWGPVRPGVTSTLKQNVRSQEWLYASALTWSVSGIAWVRPDSESRSVTQRTCWAHCRSCVRRNTWQRREQDVRRAAPKRRYSQMRRAQFDDFGVERQRPPPGAAATGLGCSTIREPTPCTPMTCGIIDNSLAESFLRSAVSSAWID